jgi:hypothetical protein
MSMLAGTITLTRKIYLLVALMPLQSGAKEAQIAQTFCLGRLSGRIVLAILTFDPVLGIRAPRRAARASL